MARLPPPPTPLRKTGESRQRLVLNIVVRLVRVEDAEDKEENGTAESDWEEGEVSLRGQKRGMERIAPCLIEMC
jgi:hypothetical protein